MDANFKEGFWRLADPKISITSAASMTIGASLAADHPDFSWLWVLIAALAFFCMEVAKNAWGDVYDYDSGTDLAVAPEDRTSFSGGKRVMVDHILSRRQTWGIAIGFGLSGIALGAVMVFFREPSVFWIGVVGLILGWSYHGPPFQLVYRGFGELDVVFCYGPIIAIATYMLMTHQFDMVVLWLSLPLGIFIAAFLWVNEFPDFFADRSAGKNNLVVRLGKQSASRALPLIYLTGFLLLLFIPVLTDLTKWVWLGFLALVPALAAMIWCWSDPETFHRHRPVQVMALLTFVLYSVNVALGVLLGW